MLGMKMSKKLSWLWLIGLMLMIMLGCVTPFGDRPPFSTPIVAWIIPKNAPNPFGSTKLLPLLVK